MKCNKCGGPIGELLLTRFCKNECDLNSDVTKSHHTQIEGYVDCYWYFDLVYRNDWYPRTGLSPDNYLDALNPYWSYSLSRQFKQKKYVFRESDVIKRTNQDVWIKAGSEIIDSDDPEVIFLNKKE